MKNRFYLNSTYSTPKVLVDYNKGLIYLKGKSSPENTLEFYQPIFHAISRFRNVTSTRVVANFQFVYFNTSTARCIYMMMKELKTLQDGGKKVIINWIAEEDDEDMVETGMDFQDIVEIDFKVRLVANAQGQ